MKICNQIISVRVLLVGILLAGSAAAGPCPPTEPDEVGPFYKPNAPLRSKIGTGYVLSGVVRSSVDCRPLPNARIEFWQVGPQGEYDDAHRATIISDSRGRYQLVTHFPPPYMTRPSHIHILVQAPGYQRLITQHYPRKSARSGRFDLVLIPD
ncbi:intradiol ring-cleavage dioxygenase [Geobacter sp. DSM 9736]|uniref:dioxygenase family protein n=1 Tax=Geobacter sp. DSM 9736 TaxID=1277350 RepID=UPI000B5095B9|nr:intradiol ring-cleavage dioxygenase [Geobacter sp. DSM 9736]SNB47262.1 Dioxygenase [Geobacter sp. DSM 9736]